MSYIGVGIGIIASIGLLVKFGADKTEEELKKEEDDLPSTKTGIEMKARREARKLQKKFEKYTTMITSGKSIKEFNDAIAKIEDPEYKK